MRGRLSDYVRRARAFAYALFVSMWRSSLVRAFVTLSAAGFVARVASLAAYPFLTSLYSAEDFGRYGQLAAWASLAGSVATLKYEFSFSLPRSKLTWMGLVWAAIGSASIATTFLGVILLGWYVLHPIFVADGARAFDPIFLLIPLAVAGLSAYSVASYVATRERDFVGIGRTQVWKVLVETCSQAAMGLLGAGALGLAIGYVSGLFSGVGSLLRRHFSAYGLVSRPKAVAVTVAAAKKYNVFPRYFVAAGLLNEGASRLPFLAMAAAFSDGAAGHLFIALMLLDGPTSLIVTAGSRSFFERLSRMQRQGTESAQPLLRTFFLVSGIVSLAAFAALLLLIDPAVKLIFGTKWAPVADIIKIMAPAYVAMVVFSTPINLYILKDRPLALWWNAAYFALCVGSTVAAIALGLGMLEVVFAYSTARVLGYALHGYIGYHGFAHAPRV